MLQTFVNECANYSAGYFALVIIDECRCSIYGKWRRALDHFGAIKIGLTATPCVMRDAPEIGEEDRVTIRDTLRFFEVDRPTFSYTLAEAIADGHLVPQEIYCAMTVRTAATEGFPVARNEIDWDALEEPTRAQLRHLVMARFTHSTILYRRMRGRGTRQSPGKTRFTMFDFTGVTLRHGDDKIPNEGGPIVIRERRKPTSQTRRILTLDVQTKSTRARGSGSQQTKPATPSWMSATPRRRRLAPHSRHG